MWIALAGLVGLILGISLGILAVAVSARIVENLKSNRTILTGSQRETEPYPFVIKDDQKELQIEQEHLGYKPLDKFDIVEGLGR